MQRNHLYDHRSGFTKEHRQLSAPTGKQSYKTVHPLLMKNQKRTFQTAPTLLAVALLFAAGCVSKNVKQSPVEVAPETPAEPATLDMQKAKAEVAEHYAKAHPEIQEFVLLTARTFGPRELWLNEDAFAALTKSAREKKVRYLTELLKDAEYGRHLCSALAEAGALKDPRLVPGLMKIAAFHQDDRDYDCRPKWMAVAALSRQESDDAVPLLISLVDHGNQNTRYWARAALARKMGQDFRQDKLAWAGWWESSGHATIAEKFLKPWAPPQTNQ